VFFWVAGAVPAGVGWGTTPPRSPRLAAAGVIAEPQAPPAAQPFRDHPGPPAATIAEPQGPARERSQAAELQIIDAEVTLSTSAITVSMRS
jgi:hypothetical protein